MKVFFVSVAKSDNYIELCFRFLMPMSLNFIQKLEDFGNDFAVYQFKELLRNLRNL